MALFTAFTNRRSLIISSFKELEVPKIWFQSVHMFYNKFRWDCFYIGNITAVLYDILARETTKV